MATVLRASSSICRSSLTLRVTNHSRASAPKKTSQASRTFLEWYGTELICTHGHGLLHVPEIPTISFRTQRWLAMDPSWQSLFVP